MRYTNMKVIVQSSGFLAKLNDPAGEGRCMCKKNVSGSSNNSSQYITWEAGKPVSLGDCGITNSTSQCPGFEQDYLFPVQSTQTHKYKVEGV
jgi:hypothetical protein